ncbi:MAG: response regulator [Desulfobacteraceae bacterium]|nr:response regulator [Desulfobacteraceae bacterium]
MDPNKKGNKRMKKSRQKIQSFIFEEQLLSYPEVLRIFIYFLVPFLSFFNINCGLTKNIAGLITLTYILLGFIIIMFTMKNDIAKQTRLYIYRYVFRSQLVVFGIFLTLTIGIDQQLDYTPWTFLFIVLAFIFFSKDMGIIVCTLFIGSIAIFIAAFAPHLFNDHFQFMLRLFVALTLVSVLSYSSLKIRMEYLTNLYETQSDLKASEKDARKLNEKLLAEIEHRDKIESKLHQAIKMETVGKMAAGVAHDLNNILSGIVTYPDLLLLDMEKGDPMYNKVVRIRNSGSKAAALVEDLLTLSRRGVKISGIVDLRQIVDDYLASPEFHAFISRHPTVRIKTRYEGDIMNIKGSLVHLSKTLMNLVFNAAEAMPDGGDLLITITQDNLMPNTKKKYDLPKGKYVVLSVTDNGIGISKEDLERIFEPFYTKKVMGRSGTGLGMAVVQGAVLDHGGRIDIDSTPGKGTNISIFFPATFDAVPDEIPSVNVEDITGNNETILVIDDVPEQRQIAQSLLTRLGYNPSTCSSGEEAIGYLKNRDADLLIIDMIMDPGIDGLETYKQILEFKPGQKAIFATGFTVSQKIKDAKKLGAEFHVLKPYTLENIGIVLKNELER